MHDIVQPPGIVMTWLARLRQRAGQWVHTGKARWHRLHLRRVGAAKLPAQRLAAPGVGRFSEGQFGTEPSRRFMLYEPASRSRGRSPLVVMLHGCQQGAEDFAASTGMNAAAEERGVFVLYPEQSLSANALRCWSWYALQDRSHGSGEAALIAALTRHITHEHELDMARVYVAGLSAGGGMAAVLARDYPRLYAALGVQSGTPAGMAHDLISAMRLMSRGPNEGQAQAARAVLAQEGDRDAVATIVFHGDEDVPVHPSNSEALHDAAGGQAAPALTGCVVDCVPAQADQHAYTRSIEFTPGGLTRRELWLVHGAGHAWYGGGGTLPHTDPRGPDASREMLRFFLQHHLAGPSGDG